jgi:hypothetical protein
MITQLYFWKPLIIQYQNDLSLIDDYYRRTIIVFSDIEKEAQQHAQQLYENYPGSEDTDAASVAEWAEMEGVERFQTLALMKANHLLMTITMLYHLWEQQLIKFTLREMSHYLKSEKKAADFFDIQEIFRLHGVDIDKTESWTKIRELKFLVNTIKHGDGTSADKLRKIRPDFFDWDVVKMDTLELSGAVLLDNYSLQVSEKDLYSYIEATKNFWDEMPERAYSDTETIIEQFKKQRRSAEKEMV